MKTIYGKLKRMRKYQGQPIRHTHPTAAALEDLIAIQFELIDFLEYALLYAKQRTEKMYEISKTVRRGPHAYDPETQSSIRVVVKKR
jgi:hypothetical protein